MKVVISCPANMLAQKTYTTRHARVIATSGNRPKTDYSSRKRSVGAALQRLVHARMGKQEITAVLIDLHELLIGQVQVMRLTR
jgi:hypothetical protein